MIRFAATDDIPDIMDFIDTHWRKGHIMGNNRELFEFQHKWENEISFVLSETDGSITGILGYIPYGNHKRDVALAIWKTLKTGDTMQGVNMLSFLRENADIRTVSAPGINPKTISIYKFLGFETGKMKQWYRLRKSADYKIAKVINTEIPDFVSSEGVSVAAIENFKQAMEGFGLADCLFADRHLQKSEEFINRRYFSHPIFRYLKYGIRKGEKKLLVVMRIQECNRSSLLRIIDCIGDDELLAYFTATLDRLLDEYGCEYADCYETGVEAKIFQDGGWKDVISSGNIMPDYFAPFEQRNIDIFYMSEIKGAIMFKGDGDMDRPN